MGMSTDILKSKNTQGLLQWTIVPGTQRQSVVVDISKAGVLAKLLTMSLKALGGWEQIFANAVWPRLVEVISDQLGQSAMASAFEKVGFGSARTVNDVHVFAACEGLSVLG